MKFYNVGDELETVVVAVTKDCVFLDMNSKSEGICDISEFQDENGKINVVEGDKIKVYFVGFINGEMRFTSKIAGDKADNVMLENAWKNSIPVEGTVEKEIKGGYEIKLGSSRAFCPYSQMGFRSKEKADYYIGRTMTFRITEFKDDGRNILVSNRIIKEEEHNDNIKKLQEKIVEGAVVKGTIISLQEYGAFVDINGFQALLPISEISRSRVTNIEDILHVGQKIEAEVLKTDWKNEKISLSMKSLLDDPWDSVTSNFKAEQKLNGKISRVADFGIFVELTEGINGLIHVSELENAGHNTNIRKLFKVGDTMSVIIKSVDAQNRRISLKTASSNQQDLDTEKYLDQQDDAGIDTYNPFAALLKK
ncbi:MAG: S1 RNA-binding domain-containing protein [Treponema sp.]|nr:S1 RNA-binding domain-containing protein [Treponema sp.]